MVEERPSFEEVYTALEEAVQRLEAGGLALDDAITAYEEGVRLAVAARDLLNAADLRISTLADAMNNAASPDLDEDDDEDV